VELRVYYESLEQAAHYLAPLVQRGLDSGGKAGEVPIRLVVRPKNFSQADSGRLRAIYQLTTPDFLITACTDAAEIPLIVGEFSEAVLTEDHELQRAVGALAAATAGAVYLKISSKKVSDREHGGKKDFDPLSVARAMQETLGYYGVVVAQWDTVQGNPYVLKRNEQFRACPAFGASPLAEFVVEQVVSLAVSADRIEDLAVSREFHRRCSNMQPYVSYLSCVARSDSASHTLHKWSSRRKVHGWRRVEVEADKIIVKINRYSHAADPDRGILIYLSSICGKSTVLTRYSVDGYLGTDTKELVEKYCDEASAEGAQSDFVAAVRRAFSNAGVRSADITPDLVRMGDGIFSNKVLFSMLFFSDGVIIHSKNNLSQVAVKWDREEIFHMTKSRLLESLVAVLGATNLSPPLAVEQVSDSLNEDEVTYVSVHNVLRPNGFRIVAVSYPGAQGDAAILPNREAGRSQERMYVDVIAWLPDRGGRPSDELVLQEAKDVFDQAAIRDDVAKLLSIRNVATKRRALDEALARLGHGAPKHLVIGVAFGTQPGVATTWKPDEVDFIVRIVGNRKWQVAPFGGKMREYFGQAEGDIQLPVRYRIVPRDCRAQTRISG